MSNLSNEKNKVINLHGGLNINNAEAAAELARKSII